MTEEYKVDTSLTSLEYMEVVDSLADRYFDQDGNYQPQWGKLGAIAIFYKLYFNSNESNEIDSGEIDRLGADKDFYRFFESCVKGEIRNGLFDFYSAYRDAMNIVEQRKSVAGAIGRGISSLLRVFEQIVDADGFRKLGELAEHISDGSLDREALTNYFVDGLSERLSKGSNENTSDENVVAFRGKE